MKKILTVIVLLFTPYFASGIYAEEVERAILFENIPGHIEDYLETLKRVLRDIDTGFVRSYEIGSESIVLNFTTYMEVFSYKTDIPARYWPVEVSSEKQDCRAVKHIVQTLKKHISVINYKEHDLCRSSHVLFDKLWGTSSFTAKFDVLRRNADIKMSLLTNDFKIQFINNKTKLLYLRDMYFDHFTQSDL